uniref:Internal scaffolding protein n=1 Tax=Dulem virus 111 TaxID=3145588 RepID=A0AAU8AWE0_9VIRU
MMFKTQYMKTDRVASNLGTRDHVLYSPVFDQNGNMHLEESGHEDIYDFIQSHKDSCDIHTILARYSNGDLTALSRVQGVYGDFTQVPKTLMDSLNIVIRAQNTFMSLPVEEREKYGHSFERWLAEFDKQAAAAAAPVEQASKAAPAAGDEEVKESAK